MISLDVPTPRKVRTSATRVVGYYDFGDRDGIPMLALHGTPSSGAGFAWADEPARERGIRLLAPDRPGIGYSDRWPRANQMAVVDYPPELIAFADALDIESFPVLGYSGGGPYALAAAHASPQRVRAAAVVAGAGHIGEWASLEEYETTDRQLSQLATRAPALARAALSASAFIARVAPRVSVRFAQLELPPPDREVLAKFPSPRTTLATFTQAVLRDANGVVDDYAALARRWGFTVEDIAVPVQCWHGSADRTVPMRHSEELVARIPGARLTRWDGDGHLALIERVGEVLDGLLELTHS